MGRNNLASAVWTTVAAIVCGCALFQATSLSFDYMKLRQLPIYASATSIGEFASTVGAVSQEMRERRGLVRALLRDRSTVDFDIFTAQENARRSIVEARNFLRNGLKQDQLVAIGFDQAKINFVDTDRMFQRYCSTDENSLAQNAIAGLDDGAAAPAAPPSATANKGLPALSDTQRPLFQTACAITKTYCVGDRPSETSGERARMICAQNALQGLSGRSSALKTFSYDGAQYLADALKLSYPELQPTDMIRALQVVETYRALTLSTKGRECSELTDLNAKQCTTAGRNNNWLAPFWDFLLSQPLAVMYMILALLFGGLGNLSSYLFATVAPERIATTPEEGPWYAALAGGGSAILVLLVVMAGFQFFAVGGASTPDLAYPNPLTVCGLAVLVGLRGDAVLTALKDWVTKFFSGETAQNPATPPVPPPTPDPIDADHTEKT